MILWPYAEHGTIILVIIQPSTVGSFIWSFGVPVDTVMLRPPNLGISLLGPLA